MTPHVVDLVASSTTPPPAPCPPSTPANRMQTETRRRPGRVIGVLSSSFDARLRAELRGLTTNSDTAVVRAALAAAGLHLQLDTVRAWIDTLTTRKDTPS